MKKRLFIAVPLPQEQLDELSSYSTKYPSKDVRWTAPENLHITVYFCGNTDEEKIQEMNTKLEQALKSIKPFNLDWKELHFAPLSRPPRMIWAQFEASQEFTKLVHTIYEVVKEFLDDSEKPHPKPIPHVTVARFKNPRVAEEIDLTQPKINTLKVDKIELISSELSTNGPKYSVLHNYKLQ